jgi:hypothetical protein
LSTAAVLAQPATAMADARASIESLFMVIMLKRVPAARQAVCPLVNSPVGGAFDSVTRRVHA